MKVYLPDGAVREGRGIDLSDTAFAPETVVAAVRDPGSPADALRIDCPEPDSGHDVLARVPISTITTKRLSTAVARSRGRSSPVDEELDRLTSRLAEYADTDDDYSTPLRAARRRLAEAGDDEAGLRERTASLRGRLAAHREAGDDDAIEATRAELVDVATQLSEVETERIAAEQRLEALEREAKRARDSRDERLRLTDAVANRRREARTYFADTLAAEFDEARDALSALSSETTDTDTLTALAAVRLADFRAPVVSTCRFFADAETAAHHLDCPVIRL
ncbi:MULTISPECIES: hypothetical protein [Haloferax]|uniref:Uncharacterized protein n=1 Tax=Haloferax marinum TaxID=2666143 RepID=A0A6A8G8F3_9EURY|nr:MULTISPECIES: hypothetical protein [Haloferax]KAB1197508.1 hypothetical protein Hfx1150_08250 [Haloferax sp. CBA1150]MRW96553.1 hypothetical protein [Haloferax marinum]